MTAPIQHPISVADVLDRAADLIEPEGAWTQGAYGRDADGKNLADGRSDSAQCWCVVGALEKASGGLVGSNLTAPIYNILGLILEPTIVAWNDAPERTQAEVVAALRSAATAARQEQSHEA